MHGYWVVALIVGLESVGLPLPGETLLVLAAIYAGTEPSFNLCRRAAWRSDVKAASAYWRFLAHALQRPL
jgi:hypothetical protein